MQLIINGSSEEIKKVLQAIAGGKEHVGAGDIGKTEQIKDSNAATS
jgi:hypothetical protein